MTTTNNNLDVHALAQAIAQVLLSNPNLASLATPATITQITQAPSARTNKAKVPFVKRNGEIVMVTPARAAAWEASRERMDVLAAERVGTGRSPEERQAASAAWQSEKAGIKPLNKALAKVYGTREWVPADQASEADLRAAFALITDEAERNTALEALRLRLERKVKSA